MNDDALKSAADVYALVFFSAIIILALLETLRPRRALTTSLRTRWIGNIGVTALGTLILRALLPISGIGLAYLMAERGWGLFNMAEFPAVVSIVLAILLLDFVRYVQHLLMHKIPFLWRLHRLHHTDHDMDFTTQLRVHPIEVLLGAAIGMAVIALLGPPVLALLIFNTLFAAQAFWTHSNVAFPRRLDELVRRVFTTPEVHRIHHSVDVHESNSNLGAMLTWWDRMFGTFVEQPALGHDDMILGVAEFSDPKHQSLPWMLLDPFLSQDAQTSATAPRLSV